MNHRFRCSCIILFIFILVLVIFMAGAGSIYRWYRIWTLVELRWLQFPIEASCYSVCQSGLFGGKPVWWSNKEELERALKALLKLHRVLSVVKRLELYLWVSVQIKGKEDISSVVKEDNTSSLFRCRVSFMARSIWFDWFNVVNHCTTEYKRYCIGISTT